MKRIGLFGGTFNPIHLGHLRAALEVKEGFALDRIIMIPSALPPHKGCSELVNADDRLQMIRLCTADLPEFVTSDIELKRSGHSFTIDTVFHFKSSFSKHTRLYLIMGMDAFCEINTWKSYRDLFDNIAVIVMTRPGTATADKDNRGDQLRAYIKSQITDGYSFSKHKGAYIHSAKQPIYPFHVTPMDISSTEIRRLVKTGRSIHFLVPSAVETFIKSKGLYA